MSFLSDAHGEKPIKVSRAGLVPRGRWAVTVFILASVFLTAMPVGAQSISKAGTVAGTFLEVGVGPRAAAMGGAFVGAADDASSLYWNPAGLAHLSQNAVFGTHSEWIEELNFDYVGAVFDVGALGHIGASVTYMGVPDMKVRTELRQEGSGATFDAADLAVGLSLGRSITDRFSVGATAKYVQQRIWNSHARGFAVDIGTQFRTSFFGGLTIGAAVYNFGTDMQMDGRDLRAFKDPDPTQLGNNDRVPVDYETDSWSLPLNFQIGLTTQPIDTRMNQLTVSVDALHPNSNYESVNAGFEYGFEERVFFRGGVHSLFLPDREGGLSGGIAVHQPLPYEDGLLKVDYAYRTMGRLGGAHTVGMSVLF